MRREERGGTEIVSHKEEVTGTKRGHRAERANEKAVLTCMGDGRGAAAIRGHEQEAAFAA